MGARVMDDASCRRFFLEPQSTFHRRYEALRAYFIEARPVAEVAARYNYKLEALKVMISQFRTQCRDDRLPPFSFVMGVGDRRSNHVPKTSMAPTKPQSPTNDFWT
jgi:hypothetical protein